MEMSGSVWRREDVNNSACDSRVSLLPFGSAQSVVLLALAYQFFN
jgi:hypothetical protein